MTQKGCASQKKTNLNHHKCVKRISGFQIRAILTEKTVKIDFKPVKIPGFGIF